MKTAIFFYLIGLRLALSQTTPSYTTPYTSDCILTRAAREYAGPVNVTSSGLRCQAWTSDQPHFNYYKEATLYPEGSASAAGNKCRNPDPNYNDGLWCYTVNPRFRWQLCSVNFCECKLPNDTLGIRYEGQTRFTRSGSPCRRWSYQWPPHPFNSSIYFPDASLADAANNCRNPNGSRPEGPWCYTTTSNPGWEYCSIPVCNLTAPILPTRPPTSSTSTRSSSTSAPSSSKTTTNRASSTSQSTASRTTTTRTSQRTMLPSKTTVSWLTSRSTPSSKFSTKTTLLSTTKTTKASYASDITHSASESKSSTGVVQIVVPVILVFIILALVIAVIVVCWRRPDLRHRAWKKFTEGNNESNAEEGNGQERHLPPPTPLSFAPVAKSKDSFDNPIYASDQQPITIPGITLDHSSTDNVTITDSGATYMSMSNVRLS